MNLTWENSVLTTVGRNKHIELSYWPLIVIVQQRRKVERCNTP